ncbi:tellurite resistance TerB family protein [Deinococcus lacus]|uniref:Tellurite resistance TerB family protein n=1 Tax=Deinococcus lacus TaxID=392561 RepID=A0ABW1YIT3_9DEIO
MSFLNKLKALGQQAGKEAQDTWSRYQSGPFADATMAACALIAAADGQIDPQERSRTAQFITSSEKLRSFNVADLRAKYERYCDALSRDRDFGKIEAMQAVSKLRDKEDEARAVLSLALVIANADGHFDPSEQAAARDIAAALHLSPAEFGL